MTNERVSETSHLSVRSKRKPLRTWMIFAGLILLGILTAYVLQPVEPFVVPPFETGTVKVIVVDDKNLRVANAEVTPHGLRSLLDPGTGYFWVDERHGTPISATTDENGEAEIVYPKWVTRETGMLTGAVSLVVEHPDFCVKGNLDALVPQKNSASTPPRIKVKRGGRLRIKAFREGETEPITDFETQISRVWHGSHWTIDGDTVLSPTIEAGQRVVRVVDRTDPDHLQFSPAVSVDLQIGRIEDLELHLQPRMTIRGRLDASVPRPVANGFVVASTFDGLKGGVREGISWETWTTISDEGEFEVTSLPPVKQIRLLAWCDGYVSRMPSENDVPAVLAQSLTQRVSLPQFFSVAADAIYEVLMEPAAKCECMVYDTKGKGIEGVDVSMSPNVVDELSSRIFGRTRKFEKVRFKQPSFAEFHKTLEEQLRDPAITLNPVFAAKTDATGRAVIETVPARRGGWVDAYHEALVPVGQRNPPFDYSIDINLESGKTTACKFVLEPKRKLNPKALVPAENRFLHRLQQTWVGVQSFFGW